ncbi:MAG: hypothetical protein D6775_09710 [Caldilineae bacterium]|nr:MAG: hypothetical protein D6775_09710 [Caldilineae bacterium]
MTDLTPRQRNLLEHLLVAKAPISASELGARLQLSSRQVQYSLRGVSGWLAVRGLVLLAQPGVGMTVKGSDSQKRAALQALLEGKNQNMPLSGPRRRRLLALQLLIADQPLILYQLQQAARASRRVILADLDHLAAWLPEHRLALKKRRNYGVWVDGSEKDKRQALAALIWGDLPEADGMISVSYGKGIAFAASELPPCKLVDTARQWLKALDVKATLRHVARAETQMSSRFSDDGALALALAFAIQRQRVRQGQLAEPPPEAISWLRELPLWEVAAALAERMSWSHGQSWPLPEVAWTAISLLAVPRNELWSGDAGVEPRLEVLVDDFMQEVAAAYGLPGLAQDAALREGLLMHLVPAYVRRLFALWQPVTTPETQLPAGYTREYTLAQQLNSHIAGLTGVTLAASDTCNIALLLRAAYVREQPHRPYRILLVCPSGMATSQLLMARIQARFPRLQHVEIASMRHLHRHYLPSVDLILTTAPISQDLPSHIDIIQVHPLLLPEDVEAITNWLAEHRHT